MPVCTLAVRPRKAARWLKIGAACAVKIINQSSSHFRYSSVYTQNRIGKTVSDQINGYIDDFRIYDRELSAAEVGKINNAQYIQKGSISGSTDEYIAFKTNLNIIADFTNASITNLTSWLSYGTSIFGDSFTYSLNSYDEVYGVWGCW